jgi:para-nitrobenzyl esterase
MLSGACFYQDPEPLTAWEGVLDATEPVPTCIQFGGIGSVEGTEDCLYLNVFTPRVRTCRFEFILSKYGTKFLSR